MFRHRRNNSSDIKAKVVGVGGGAPANGFSSRIPTTLQHVFLSSNRGNDVDKPPPMKVANRAFRTLWSKAGFGGGMMSSGVRTSKGGAAVGSVATSGTVESAQEEEEQQSPQDFLDAMVSQRGYSTVKYPTLQTAFYSTPTALQQASYSRYLIDLIKAHDVKKFEDCMVCGLSLNPCNSFGESLLHMVCRRGDGKLLRIMMDAGTDLHVADDYGRTPMHDACWAPEVATDVLRMILQENPANVSMFYMPDARGSLPLSYVHKDNWAEMILFLDRDKDIYWPVSMDNDNKKETYTLALLSQLPNSKMARHPHNALTLELAAMVANGRLAPEEALMLKADQSENTEEESDYDDSDDDDDDDDSEYSDDDSDDEDEDEDDEELLAGMEGILNTKQ